MDLNDGVIRSVGRYIRWKLGIGVGVEFESGYDGEVGLEVGGEVDYRDGRGGSKYVESGVNMIIDDSVGWGIDKGSGAEFCSWDFQKP